MNTVNCSNHLCGKEYNVLFDKCPFCGTDNPMDEEERKVLVEKEKAKNVSVENDTTRQFHWLIVGLIWISIIFFGVRGVFASFTNMIFSPTIGIITLVLTIVGMVSLFFILQAKKWALFLWIAYRLAGGVVNGLINTKFDFTTNIIIALVNIGLMLLILQLKKNGVSAWSLIFKKKVSKTDNKENVGEEVTSKVSQDTILVQNEERIRAEQRENRTENFTEIPSQVIADTHYDEQINHTIPEDKKLEQQVISTTPPSEEKPEDKLIDTPGDKLNTTDSRDDTPEKKKSLSRSSWWIFLIVIVAVLAAVCIVVFPHHRDSNPEIGEYVYVDKYSILHIDRNCDNIAEYRGTKPISIYSLNELTHNKWEHICSKCITDNSYKIIECHLIGNDNLRAIYNIIKTENYTPPIFEEFVKDMQEESNLRSVYATLKKEGYIVPPVEVFIEDMGYNTEQPSIRKVDIKKCNKRLLYDDLIEEYDMGSFEQFSEDVENLEKRKKLYYAIRNKYEIPSFDYFTRYLQDLE